MNETSYVSSLGNFYTVWETVGQFMMKKGREEEAQNTILRLDIQIGSPGFSIWLSICLFFLFFYSDIIYVHLMNFTLLPLMDENSGLCSLAIYWATY